MVSRPSFGEGSNLNKDNLRAGVGHEIATGVAVAGTRPATAMAMVTGSVCSRAGSRLKAQGGYTALPTVGPSR
jgi:hypothetical protein